MIESPSGRVLENAPRWDLTGTEARGGGKVFWWMLLMLGEYLGIFRAKIRVGRSTGAPQALGACPYGLWPPRGSSGLFSKSYGFLMVQEKSP